MSWENIIKMPETGPRGDWDDDAKEHFRRKSTPEETVNDIMDFIKQWAKPLGNSRIDEFKGDSIYGKFSDEDIVIIKEIRKEFLQKYKKSLEEMEQDFLNRLSWE